jgi:hypothetical protein
MERFCSGGEWEVEVEWTFGRDAAGGDAGTTVESMYEGSTQE